MSEDRQAGDAQSERPFIVPCATLDMQAPLRWLRAGWHDVRRSPGLTAVFGGVIVVVSVLIAILAWKLGRFALLATLLSGFVFVAPLICVGLYCVSRALERGQTPHLSDSFALARRVLGQAAVFALAQGVIILLWSRAGMVITALSPTIEGDRVAFIEYLLIGSAVGAIFAALTFAVAVVSLPLIADRDIDMVTAGISSVNAVLRNKPPMALWAAIIVVLTMIGFATAFIGLGLIMPWLAYSSWHAYRETLRPDAWPALT
ncbi:MAG: DUF2189 domain-containing protein [Xanthomonadaceae bacterium]|nr:DUF2189 domain-containing protein [Xanthomonadaceae bacterium]